MYVFLLDKCGPLLTLFCCVYRLLFCCLVLASLHSIYPEASHPLIVLQLKFSDRDSQSSLSIPGFLYSLLRSGTTIDLLSHARDLNAVSDGIIHSTRFSNSADLQGHKPKMVLVVFFRIFALSGIKLNLLYPPFKIILGIFCIFGDPTWISYFPFPTALINLPKAEGCGPCFPSTPFIRLYKSFSICLWSPFVSLDIWTTLCWLPLFLWHCSQKPMWILQSPIPWHGSSVSAHSSYWPPPPSFTPAHHFLCLHSLLLLSSGWYLETCLFGCKKTWWKAIIIIYGEKGPDQRNNSDDHNSKININSYYFSAVYCMPGTAPQHIPFP